MNTEDIHTQGGGGRLHTDDLDRFVRTLGVDVDRLDPYSEAVFLALSQEVLSLRGELSTAKALADHDALCPVFNRRAFEREVTREISRAERFDIPLSLIFIDLDGFKQVNDVFGHSVGDNVLIHISETLISMTRDSDIVGRLGGDEFGIVLSNAYEEHAIEKANKIAKVVDELIVRPKSDSGTAATEVSIGASCGVAEWKTGQSATDLIARADRHMFEVKNARKTR